MKVGPCGLGPPMPIPVYPLACTLAKAAAGIAIMYDNN
jgi:hypothetical protein